VTNGRPEQATELEQLRGLYESFTGARGDGRSLVYQALTEGILRDESLLALLLETPGEQRRPSLLFAGVNLLLVAHPGSQLAAYYPIHGGQRPVDEQLVPAFRAFCEQHHDELVGLVRTRSTQTNDIRRCVALHLGLDYVHRQWMEPLALVEVGASAGLNLLFDRYRYRLGGRESSADVASSVVIACDVREGSSIPILGPAPQLTHRLGIDLSPIDVTHPDARAWLEAFIWPEQVEELSTLRAAFDIAISSALPAVVTGGATTDTARILGDLAGDEPVVVFTASLLSYLTSEARTAFVTQLGEAARRRPVAWVFAEAPGLLRTTDLDMPVLRGPVSRSNSAYLVGASMRHGTDRNHDQALALADPYLRWLAPAKGAADDLQWVGCANVEAQSRSANI
jgi:hypothetical protein